MTQTRTFTRWFPLLILLAMLLAAVPIVLDRFGIGHEPTHVPAYITWWPAPTEARGVIELRAPRRSGSGIAVDVEVLEHTYGNADHELSFSYRFLRNTEKGDLYRFDIEFDNRRESSNRSCV